MTSKTLDMECVDSNGCGEGNPSDDQDHVQCKKKLKTTPSPAFHSLIAHFINTILSESRDNCAERLNLDVYTPSLVEAQQTDMSVTSGIIVALQLNQWLVATTVCHLNVTENFYLPPQVLLNLLHRVLQTHDNGELGEIMGILRRHAFLHPPCYSRVSLRQLYTTLLVEQCREMLNGDKKAEEGLVVQVLDELRQIFQSDHVDSDKALSEEEYDVAQPLSELVYAMESGEVYSRLSAEEKLIRLDLVLDYAVIVLEQDFLAWHKSRRHWSSLGQTLNFNEQRPLIVALAWPRVKYWRIGTCNAFCRRVAQMVWFGKLQEPLLRLLTLLAEVMHISECEGKFPAMGDKCWALAREVSLGMSESPEQFLDQAFRLKPAWLGLLVVHQAITKVIQPGNVGMPSLDLVEACMTLVDHVPVEHPQSVENDVVDLDLAEPPAKINKRYVTGVTRLHRACKKNDVSEVKNLLRQPHINVNVTDNSGWTALHEAVGGRKECVRILLDYRSHSGMTVDVRAKSFNGVTPIMEAAARGEAEICDMLLKNSGWCILEDCRADGMKAENMAKTLEVAAVLAASRLGKQRLVTCIDLPLLEIFLPEYLKLYLDTYKIHLVAIKARGIEAPSSHNFKKNSKCFDLGAMFRSLKVFENLNKASVPGSLIDRILKGYV